MADDRLYRQFKILVRNVANYKAIATLLENTTRNKANVNKDIAIVKSNKLKRTVKNKKKKRNNYIVLSKRTKY